jgi:hypothetical protein
LQLDSEALAEWADWPVNEADLHAKHHWLTNNAEFRQRMHAEPDYQDFKVAGWWVNGICQWIGGGWCEHPEWQQLPHLGDAGRGINRPSQKLPHLGNAGRGINRPSQKLPHLGNAGRGINRPSQQRPHLGDAGRGRCAERREELIGYFGLLADRLRDVRVCCGNWDRVLGETPTVKLGMTAVFLDPPYSAEAGRDESLYAQESLDVAHAVREWAIANGDNKHLRICLCGYEGEHVMPDSWECVAWKAKGGYGSRNANGNKNPNRERLWFSPHCLRREREIQRSFV